MSLTATFDPTHPDVPTLEENPRGYCENCGAHGENHHIITKTDAIGWTTYHYVCPTAIKRNGDRLRLKDARARV